MTILTIKKPTILPQTIFADRDELVDFVHLIEAKNEKIDPSEYDEFTNPQEFLKDLRSHMHNDHS